MWDPIIAISHLRSLSSQSSVVHTQKGTWLHYRLVISFQYYSGCPLWRSCAWPLSTVLAFWGGKYEWAKPSKCLVSLIAPQEEERGVVPSIKVIRHFLFLTLCFACVYVCVSWPPLIPALTCAWAMNPHSSKCLIPDWLNEAWYAEEDGITPFSLQLGELLFWKDFVKRVTSSLRCQLHTSLWSPSLPPSLPMAALSLSLQ